MKNLKTVFAAFREMPRLEKRLIPTAVTVALVTAVMPFVNIWFTSKIIDLLDGGASMKSLALYIGLAVGINALLFFINYYLGDMQFVHRSLMHKSFNEFRQNSSLLSTKSSKAVNSRSLCINIPRRRTEFFPLLFSLHG